MPIYTYKCSECEGIFEKFHLMSETLEQCALCDKTDCLEKIPSFLLDSLKKSEIKKVGAVVENHIKQIREDLKQEKKDLRNREL